MSDPEIIGGGRLPGPLGRVSPEIVRLEEAEQRNVVQVCNGNRGAGASVLWDVESEGSGSESAA